MKRLKAAVVGMGFIGFAHVEALRRIPHVDGLAQRKRPNGWAFPRATRIMWK